LACARRSAVASGVSVGSAIVDVTAASGMLKLYNGANATGASGPEVNWTAGQAVNVTDSTGQALNVTIGDQILLNSGDTGSAYQNLTINDNALQFQLGSQAGQTASLSLLDTATGQTDTVDVVTKVRFRNLPDASFDAYLRAEEPYDCAGSAKSEGLGIALLEAIESDDPTALIGLPLIALTRMLLAAGYPLLEAQ